MAPSLSKTEKDTMGVTNNQQNSNITLENSNFTINGHPILTEVPSNITAIQSSHGCFVGFNAEESRNRHVVPIGKLKGIRFLSIFRFKIWWSTHWIGNSGKDVEHETQIMVLEKNELGRPYVVVIPLIEGSFRTSLQPGVDDYVDICVESGSSKVNGSSFKSCLYVHGGDDPFSLVEEAMKVVRIHLGTFKLLEEKNPPGIIEKFGWCTWDAFYRKVEPRGVLEGIRSLVEGGVPPGFVIIDDGWQSICPDEQDTISDVVSIENKVAGLDGLDARRIKEGADQIACRLISFEENYKFRDYRSSKDPLDKGMCAFVKDLKQEFRTLEYVYLWHAMCAHWGGLRPHVPGMPKSRLVIPKLSKSLEMAMEDLALNNILKSGVGFVSPELAQEMYDGLHCHIQSMGVDGVKIDVGEILELLCEEYGGRVELAKPYFKALSESLKKHFKGNGVIASMNHCNDFMFLGTEAIALGRVGDDFWCVDPCGDKDGVYWLQGCHMVHCAYNSLWMGNFLHPDWDMFQSAHPCAEFHAASRAISGGPVYVSDSVGEHNFKLLKMLVLPDGSILRSQHYALPTRDCLFNDPLHDGKTILKIWSLNKFSGVLGLFNCQGGGWCPLSRRNKNAAGFSLPINSIATPKDIEWSNGKYPISLQGVTTFAVYMFRRKELKIMELSEEIQIMLQPITYELITVSPVTILPEKSIQFSAIGLVNMLNSGGAIQYQEFDENLARIGVKGHGEMKTFASEKPKGCRIDGEDVEFGYDEEMVTVEVVWPNSSKVRVIEYLF